MFVLRHLSESKLGAKTVVPRTEEAPTLLSEGRVARIVDAGNSERLTTLSGALEYFGILEKPKNHMKAVPQIRLLLLNCDPYPSRRSREVLCRYGKLDAD